MFRILIGVFSVIVRLRAIAPLMALLRSVPGQFWTSSRKFEQGFMDIFSRRFRSKRVHSNIVYNEYIADKEHVHMNSTKWSTLAEFVGYLVCYL